MIVNPIPEGWEIIYQQAHGMLAMDIASHWRMPAEIPARHRAETLAAIAEHDDGQADWRGRDGLTPAGAPADFMLAREPSHSSLDQPREVLRQARFQGRWRLLLTSMHLSFLMEPRRGVEGTEFGAFLDELRELQRGLRRSLRINKDVAGASYRLLEWCDRLSLILCRGELPQGERRVEVTEGPDGTRHQAWLRGGDGVVLVEPWPFERDRVVVGVDAQRVRQLRFEDDEELAAALREAPFHRKEWTLAAR